jgi:hypothetical protein
VLIQSCAIYLQVLEISPRELSVRNDLNLSLSLLGDLDDVAEISDAAVNLNFVLEEFLESRDIEDLVTGGLRSIDDELYHSEIVILMISKTMVVEAYLLRHLGLLALRTGFLHCK